MDSLSSFAPPSVLPDISPTRGEIGSHRRVRHFFNVARLAKADDDTANLPPCGGDVRQDRGGRRRAPSVEIVCSVCLAASAPLLPTPAFAHASDRGHVLLLPTGYYVAGGAFAVAVSFLVLALLPPDCARPLLAPAPAAFRLRRRRPHHRQPDILCRLCNPHRRRPVRQPRPALQPAAAGHLDAALGRPRPAARPASAISGHG